MIQNRFPVVIVGGGIVGLSASLCLSSHNISHLLIERHAGSSILPRARGNNTRAMEIYRSLGIDEAVREAGAELAPSKGILKGASFVEVMEPRKRAEDGNQSEMPFAKYGERVSPAKGARVTQDMLEPLLVGIARERGGQIRFNTSCEEIQQDEKCVTLKILDRESHETSTVHADYVIAADGAGSPIRKSLGIGTTGKRALGNLINIYFLADMAELVRGREISLCTIERPEVRGLLTSIDNKSRWAFHLSYDPSKGEKAEDYPKQRCEELIRIAMGLPDLKIEIQAIRPWQPSDVSAASYQAGRIFLAGDAAHQTTPYAGQGATTGVADVWDLSWKLSLVFKGQATPKLLETYEIERLPVGRMVAKESGELSDQYGLPKIGMTPTGLYNMIGRIPLFAGFGYQYKSGAVISESEPSSLTWWWNIPWTIPSLIMGLNGKPGTRVPHVWIQHEGKQVSTLDLSGKTFVLLSGSEGKGWCQAASEIKTVDLSSYRVGPTGELSDPNRLFEYAAGISPQGALLVRPDGFVAWRVQDQSGDLRRRLDEALKEILKL